MKKLFFRGKGKIFLIIAVSLAALTLISLLASAVVDRNSGGTVSGGETGSTVSALPYGQRASDYATLYVQDGLTACYLSYTDEGLELGSRYGAVNYYWKNYVQGGKDAQLTIGADARLANYQIWRRMNGGIGYVVMEGNRDSVNNVGLSIPYSLTLQDMPSYQMECVATFLGMTSKTEYAEDSERLYYTKTQMESGVMSDEKESSFRLGLLHSFNYLTLHEKASMSYCNRWYLSNQSFYGHQHVPSDYCEVLQYEYDQGFDFRLGEHMATDAWKNPVTWSVVRSSYVDSLQRAKVIYGIRYSYAGEALIPDFAQMFDRTRIAELEAYEDEYEDSVGDFSLFNEYGGVIYSVRLYDRPLESEEAARNSFVDLLAFYSVNVNFLSGMNAEEVNAFLTECGEQAAMQRVAMAVDQASAAANRAQIYKIINAVFGE